VWESRSPPGIIHKQPHHYKVMGLFAFVTQKKQTVVAMF